MFDGLELGKVVFLGVNLVHCGLRGPISIIELACASGLSLAVCFMATRRTEDSFPPLAIFQALPQRV